MNICEKVRVMWKIASAALVISTLAACQEDFTLIGEDGTAIGKGALTVNMNSTLASFIINGKAYTGSWKASNAYDPDEAKRYKLMGGRSYENYMNGNQPDQLKQAHTELTAADGTIMTCDFRYHRQPGAGICSVGGISIKLAIQHE